MGGESDFWLCVCWRMSWWFIGSGLVKGMEFIGVVVKVSFYRVIVIVYGFEFGWFIYD